MTARVLAVTATGARLGGRHLPCATGRGGIRADKREGDGATPAARMRIAGLMYRPDRYPRATLPPWARVIRRGDLWSDDPADPAYNRYVRAPHDFGHETLRRADRLYDLVLLTDWNACPPLPGCGSAIFIHRWRKPRHPTEGCIAFAPADLLWLAWQLPPGTPVVVRG